MAKRLRDTRLTREIWYRKLPPKLKCAWNFICDECDQAGMWAIDMDAMSFFVGEEIEFQDFFNSVNKDKKRLEMFGNDKVWISGFVEFQAGTLSDKSPAHKPIFHLLKKYRLLDRVLSRVSSTLQEKETEKEKEIEKEKEEEKRKIEDCLKIAIYDNRWVQANKTNEHELRLFNGYLEKQGTYEMNPLDYKRYFGKLKGKYPEMIKKKYSVEELREIAKEMDKEAII